MNKGYNNEPFPSRKFQQVIADYLAHKENTMSTQYKNIGDTIINLGNMTNLDSEDYLGELYAYTADSNVFLVLSKRMKVKDLQIFIDALQKIVDKKEICRV